MTKNQMSGARLSRRIKNYLKTTSDSELASLEGVSQPAICTWRKRNRLPVDRSEYNGSLGWPKGFGPIAHEEEVEAETGHFEQTPHGGEGTALFVSPTNVGVHEFTGFDYTSNVEEAAGRLIQCRRHLEAEIECVDRAIRSLGYDPVATELDIDSIE